MDNNSTDLWWIAPAIGAVYGAAYGIVSRNAGTAIGGGVLGAAAGLLVEGILSAPEMPSPVRPPPRMRVKRARVISRNGEPKIRVTEPSDAPPQPPEGVLYPEMCLDDFMEWAQNEGTVGGMTEDPANPNAIFLELTDPSYMQYVMSQIQECNPDRVEVIGPETMRVTWTS